MYRIIESKNMYGTIYIIETYIESKLITTDIVQIKSFSTYVDGKKILMIYDSSMKPIESAIHFLNWGMLNSSENYIFQSITALKLLYSYLELFNVSLKDITKKQALGLLNFLKGISQLGLIYTTELTTVRKNESISCYLKVIRKYITFLQYDNNILLKKSNFTNRLIFLESYPSRIIDSYDISIKNNNNEYVPAYISLDEYKSIIDIVDKHYTLRDKVIVRLMYEHGLRLGEVLGLTLEDFKQKVDNNFIIEYSIELRNRVTDTREQRAKTCMKVLSPSNYKDPNYNKQGVGYHKIIVSENLGIELIEYINTSHNITNADSDKRYNSYSKADSVLKGTRKLDKNFYLFLNTIGKPLSENLWNKQLRKIFLEAGLPIDYKVRQNNLSHRFRHGYAMYLTNILKISPFDIKALMRHKQLSTTSIYQNPTPEDIANLQKNIIEEWEISILKGDE